MEDEAPSSQSQSDGPLEMSIDGDVEEALPQVEVSHPPDEVFPIEKILASKRINGEVHYQIKWLGYSDTENTWEPATEIDQHFIDRFEEERKLTNKRKYSNGRAKPDSREHSQEEPDDETQQDGQSTSQPSSSLKQKKKRNRIVKEVQKEPDDESQLGGQSTPMPSYSLKRKKKRNRIVKEVINQPVIRLHRPITAMASASRNPFATGCNVRPPITAMASDDGIGGGDLGGEEVRPLIPAMASDDESGGGDGGGDGEQIIWTPKLLSVHVPHPAISLFRTVANCPAYDFVDYTNSLRFLYQVPLVVDNLAHNVGRLAKWWMMSITGNDGQPIECVFDDTRPFANQPITAVDRRQNSYTASSQLIKAHMFHVLEQLWYHPLDCVICGHGFVDDEDDDEDDKPVMKVALGFDTEVIHYMLGYDSLREIGGTFNTTPSSHVIEWAAAEVSSDLNLSEADLTLPVGRIRRSSLIIGDNGELTMRECIHTSPYVSMTDKWDDNECRVVAAEWPQIQRYMRNDIHNPDNPLPRFCREGAKPLFRPARPADFSYPTYCRPQMHKKCYDALDVEGRLMFQPVVVDRRADVDDPAAENNDTIYLLHPFQLYRECLFDVWYTEHPITSYIHRDFDPSLDPDSSPSDSDDALPSVHNLITMVRSQKCRCVRGFHMASSLRQREMGLYRQLACSRPECSRRVLGSLSRRIFY